MDFNLGTIGADVVLEKGHWDKGIASLSQDEQKAAGTFQAIEGHALAVSAAMAAAGAAMLKTVKAGIDKFVQYQDALDTFAIVFGDYKKQSMEFADSLSESSRRSKTEIMGMMGEFQTMLMGMGMARKDALEFSREFSQMSVDLAAFWNRPLDEGVFAFQSALYGRTLSLRRMGLAVTDGMLKEKALSMGYADQKGEATQLGKAIAILALSKERLSFVEGNAVRSAFMFREAQNALKKEIGNVGVEIGKHISEFLQPYYEMLTKVLGRLKEFMQAYPALAKVMSLSMGAGGLMAAGAAGKGAWGWLSQFGGGAAMGAGAAVGASAMGGAAQLKEAIAQGVTQAAQYASARGMVERVGRPTQWITPEIMPGAAPFPSMSERMAAFWRLDPRRALGGGVPLLEGPTTALAMRTSVVTAAGSPALSGAAGGVMAGLMQTFGRFKESMAAFPAFFRANMRQLSAALAPVLALAKPLAAAAAALYGVQKLSESLQAEEVQKMFNGLKEGFVEITKSLKTLLGSRLFDALTLNLRTLATVVAEVIDMARNPLNKGRQIGEWYGQMTSDQEGRSYLLRPIAFWRDFSDNLQKAQDAMAQEKGAQKVIEMWKRLERETSDAIGELGEAATEFIDGATAEIKGIKINYRPELALFSDFTEQFKEVLKTDDPLVMQGFAQEMQEAYRELDGDMQARFRLKMRQYDEALKPEESFYLSEVMKTVERPDLEKEQEAAQELFRSAFEAAKEGARKAAGITDAVKQLVETIIERVKKTKEEFASKIDGLMQDIGATWGEMRDAQNMVADYEWARYDRQMQVGEGREATGGSGGIVASALNRAMGGIERPSSQSPQERELQSIREAQFRSVELQGRLVQLQEQLNFLLGGGGGVMEMARL